MLTVLQSNLIAGLKSEYYCSFMSIIHIAGSRLKCLNKHGSYAEDFPASKISCLNVEPTLEITFAMLNRRRKKIENANWTA